MGQVLFPVSLQEKKKKSQGILLLQGRVQTQYSEETSTAEGQCIDHTSSLNYRNNIFLLIKSSLIIIIITTALLIKSPLDQNGIIIIIKCADKFRQFVNQLMMTRNTFIFDSKDYGVSNLSNFSGRYQFCQYYQFYHWLCGIFNKMLALQIQRSEQFVISQT